VPQNQAQHGAPGTQPQGYEAQPKGAEAQQPLQRRVYFLSGFDPRGAAFYYRLFAEQLPAYAARTGRDLGIGRRRGQRDSLLSAWQVQDQPVGSQTDSETPLPAVPLEVCFLHWDDIARQHWTKNPLRLIGDGVEIYGWYLFGGGLVRIARLAPAVALGGLWPLLFFLACLLLALAAAGSATGALALWLQPVGIGTGAALGGVAIGLVAGLAVAALAWKLAEGLGVVWLFRSIRFTHGLARAWETNLRARVEALAGRILAQEATHPGAEVLLVGHSSGSFVMAMLAAQLRREPAWGQSGLDQRLRLLSLGQNLANLAVHRQATGFHADLQLLAQEPRLPWLDVTSKDDFLCFAGVDPYASCGLPCGGESYPVLRLIPLAQRQQLPNWWALASHQFDLHFEYLRTAQPAQSGGFDFYGLLLDRDLEVRERESSREHG
jgi:hypothetical protein